MSIVYDLPAEAYHAGPEMSKSGLDLIARSPLHYRRGASKMAYDTARIGSAAHGVVLEGGRGVITGPDAPRNTKSGKALWAEWLDSHDLPTTIVEQRVGEWAAAIEAESGLIVVTPAEREAINAMAASVREHPIGGPLLGPPGKAEVSIFGTIDDVPMRARLDWLADDHTLIVDLKTTISAERHAFRRAVASYRYHVQHAVYTTLARQVGMPDPRFVFIAVEKSPPYACAVYQLDDEAVTNGEYLMERDLSAYRECVRTDRWPGYAGDLALDIPIYESDPMTFSLNDEEIAA